jgi:predicted secreted protein
MKPKDIFTITRDVNGSTGYVTVLVRLENLALVSIDTDPLAPGLVGAPVRRHWIFQAVKAGRAEIQFAKFRPWLLPQEILYEDVLPIDVEPADEAGEEDAAPLTGAAPGGWMPFTKVSADAQKVFEEAFRGLTGITYTPLAFTSQTVNGTNYIFAVNAEVVAPGSHRYSLLIRIFKPFNGLGRAYGIYNLGGPGTVGGCGPFHETTEAEKAKLRYALRGFAGSTFDPLLTSIQAVPQGINFVFVGTQTLTTASADKYPVLFTVSNSLSNDPIFAGAQRVYDLL